MVLEDQEGSVKWNKAVLDAKTVKHLDQQTTIDWIMGAPVGPVAARDFVNVGHWTCTNGVYTRASIGTDYPDQPPTAKVVRGYNGRGGWCIFPHTDPTTQEIGRAVQQECRDRSRMPSSA
eukprot:TRINITY_DN79155_c0_g1_i1.p1 TRINITY_DN79155_c0_g1~~TRINITY_DN79155_c0_g1_i1.p1  ORF type:complete len:120 (+),score=20.36 TRINITY_DN79155_c0_g1_i1:84-443(+)